MPFVNELLIIFLMLFFNAIFAAYEMALASVSRARLALLVQKKRKGAEDAAFMKDRMEASLAVVQVGITLVGAIAAGIGGAGAAEIIEPQITLALGIPVVFSQTIALALIIIPLSALSIVFAELVPKTFAYNNREWVCLNFSPFMKVLYYIFYPVVIMFETIVRNISKFGAKKFNPTKPEDVHGLHELRAAASVARTLRLIGAHEEKIVHSATELSTRPVHQIIIPAQEISMIPMKWTLSEALIKAHLDMHTRYPVCEAENDPQSIAGYVNFKDIIFALNINPQSPTIQGIVRPIKSVSANSTISYVLEEMIRETTHIALVKDERGKILGLVTLEDLIEELVGEIEDEYDRLPTHIHPYVNGWIMGGGVSMREIAHTTNLKQLITKSPAGENLNLADWCSLGRAASLKGGEVVEKEGLVVTVKKLRRTQLAEALVSVSQSKEPSSKES